MPARPYQLQCMLGWPGDGTATAQCDICGASLNHATAVLP